MLNSRTRLLSPGVWVDLGACSCLEASAAMFMLRGLASSHVYDLRRFVVEDVGGLAVVAEVREKDVVDALPPDATEETVGPPQLPLPSPARRLAAKVKEKFLKPPAPLPPPSPTPSYPSVTEEAISFKSSPTCSSVFNYDPETGEVKKKVRLPPRPPSAFSSLLSDDDGATVCSMPRVSDFSSEEELMEALFEASYSLRDQAIPEDRSVSSTSSSLYPPTWDRAKSKSKASAAQSQSSAAPNFQSPAKEQLFLSTTGPKDEDFFLGKIKFGLAFHGGSKRVLTVRIVQAKDLRPPRADQRPPSTLVRFHFIPGGSKYQAETLMVLKCDEPVWRETFLFEGFSRRRLKGRKLVLCVIEKQTFGEVVYGNLEIPLDFLHYRLSTKAITMWKYIRPDSSEHISSILLSLTFCSRDEKVVFGLHKALDLRNTSVTNIISPFVRVVVKHKGKGIFSKDTAIVKHDMSPEWKEYLEMKTNGAEVADFRVDVMVKDGGVQAFGHGNFIARVRLGAGIRGQGTWHWQKMMKNPMKEIFVWHRLSSDINS